MRQVALVTEMVEAGSSLIIATKCLIIIHPSPIHNDFANLCPTKTSVYYTMSMLQVIQLYRTDILTCDLDGNEGMRGHTDTLYSVT